MKKLLFAIAFVLAVSALSFGQEATILERPARCEDCDQKSQPLVTGIIEIVQEGTTYHGIFSLYHLPETGPFSPEQLWIDTSPLISGATHALGFPKPEYDNSTVEVLIYRPLVMIRGFDGQEFTGYRPTVIIRVGVTAIYLHALTGDFSCVKEFTSQPLVVDIGHSVGFTTWLWNVWYWNGMLETNIGIRKWYR